MTRWQRHLAALAGLWAAILAIFHADAADMPEVRMLARDYGVEAGSQTKENIRNIALRPAAQSCFAGRGVPQVR